MSSQEEHKETVELAKKAARDFFVVEKQSPADPHSPFVVRVNGLADVTLYVSVTRSLAERMRVALELKLQEHLIKKL